jgi:putative MATE family efflux protein
VKEMENIKQLHKQQRKQGLILHNKNLYYSILILAMPIFLSNLMKAFNNLIDMYWVSNLVQGGQARIDSAISAVSIPGPIIDVTHAIAGGFMTAGAAIISQYLGAKQKENANKVAGQLLTLCIYSGLAMNILLYFTAPWLMKMMGAEGVTWEFMVQYVRIRSFEMIPLFTFFAFQASRNASGDTFSPFILNIVMIAVNVVASWYFMKYKIFATEVMGAAWGTVLGNAIIMPIYIYMMFKGGKKFVSINMIDVKPDRAEIIRIFRLSWPISVAQGLTSLGFTIINWIIYSYGESTVNAFSLGNRINSLILMPAMGIGSITATFVGQNIGARNIIRAKQSIKTAFILSVLAAIIGSLIVWPLRHQIIGLFLKEEGDTLYMTLDYLFFLLAGLPLMSVIQVFMGAFQGSGETKYSLIMSMLRLWAMRIPMLLVFIKVMHLDEPCLWYAMVISNFGAVYVATMLYTRCKFTPRVKIDQEEELCIA